MKILMLGWEYPPHISGGLGTACAGLTTGLSRFGIQMTFVVPHIYGDENVSHMKLTSPSEDAAKLIQDDAESNFHKIPKFPIKEVKIPSFLKPYWSYETFNEAHPPTEILEKLKKQGREVHYGMDLFSEVDRYTSDVVNMMADKDFDIIHAHDWMTFKAGIALKHITGKPLVVHVHSLEVDRSGAHINQTINAIEQLGLEASDKIVAVSYFTRGIIEQHHKIPREKISVVHNGVYPRNIQQNYKKFERFKNSKVVLFLGRVTFQKGPDYFVEAAAKIVPQVPDALFVIAGEGDMLPSLIKRVSELGLTENFLFPGFLRGPQVEQMFSIADLYVMPSVSEPFGITALESISFETPVIISRQSGVSEVLSHALKVDFWDVDRMADLIINALLHRELREDMISMAKEEVKRVRWEVAAAKMVDIYREVCH